MKSSLEPICPNDEIDRLRSILEESAPELISQHTLQAIALILERLRNAQAGGLVLPNPKDPRSWEEASRDQHKQEIQKLLDHLHAFRNPRP